MENIVRKLRNRLHSEGDRSLSFRIAVSMTTLVIVVMVIVTTVFAIAAGQIFDTVQESNRKMSETSLGESLVTIGEMTRDRMIGMAVDKAETADQLFREFEVSVSVVAAAAEQVYSHPERYQRRPVSLPDPEQNGSLSVQILYSPEFDPDDPADAAEADLLGNIADTLYAVNERGSNLASVYYSSESGFTIIADYISSNKYDKDGVLIPLDAKKRPWYIGAKETGDVYISSVTKDTHTSLLGIMCGVPVRKDGELMGVAGGGIYLNDIENLVKSADIGETGDACIINAKGEVIFTTFTSGTLAAGDTGSGLGTEQNRVLTQILEKAAAGESDIAVIEIDGVMYYAAYAPMKEAGWSFLIFLSKEEVEEAVYELRTSLYEISTDAEKDTAANLRSAVVIISLVLAATVILVLQRSLKVSNRIVEPIRKLTRKVSEIEGNNLDFVWDEKSGQDETQKLAASFSSLTERMKMYINDIQNITAEKERIETELSLAAKIQSSMLPSRFPAFPDRNEFDIYAVMDPAKEVGGDFYDFILLDEDHLCLVMADVSGKGIPASLFMMASKIIIANNAHIMHSPSAILEAANRAICADNPEQMFVTVWLGILEISTGRMTASNAGHEYPVIRKPGGQYEILKDRHGLVIGAMEDTVYRDYELQLEPGTRLFIYTDGLPEATDKDGQLFGEERMITTLNSGLSLDPRSVLEKMHEAVDAFAGDEDQFDDLTMMCFEYRGKQQS